MKTYTEQEVMQLLKEQREICANVAQGMHKWEFYFTEKRHLIALAPVPTAMRHLNSESLSSGQG
ncbi:MAG: hypothetical protein VYB44_07275 [Bacteroidota bacterium]|nr:hypothetical protein [Bacteroidota bacterium]